MYSLKRPIDIKFIENQTEENCFMAICLSDGEYIKYISSPSEELVKLAIKINGNNIRYISKDKHTQELCELAAIHGAPLAILGVTTPDIENIVDYVSTCGGYDFDRYGYKANRYQVSINGEKMNPGKKFDDSLLGDNIKFRQYWVQNGHELKGFDNAEVFFQNGKVYSFRKSDSYKNLTKIKMEVSKDNLYNNGILNVKYAQKAITKDPYLIFQIQEKDYSATLVCMSAQYGLPISEWDRINKKYAKNLVRGGLKRFGAFNFDDADKVLLREIYDFQGDFKVEDIKFLEKDNYQCVARFFPVEFLSKKSVWDIYNKEFPSKISSVIKYSDLSKFDDEEFESLCKSYNNMAIYLSEDQIVKMPSERKTEVFRNYVEHIKGLPNSNPSNYNVKFNCFDKLDVIDFVINLPKYQAYIKFKHWGDQDFLGWANMECRSLYDVFMEVNPNGK